MANHKSAAKRARQSVKKNARNTAALAAGDKTNAATLLNTYMSKITKAATAGVLHTKTAARKVSRLATRVSVAATK